jgi:1,4-dihydroxy-2-naphthoyl-CoA hydrolase
VTEPPQSFTPVPGTLEHILGFELVELHEDRAQGHFPVQDRVRQPFGIVHGGVYSAMAESLASWATALVVKADGDLAMGQSNFTSFLRPVSEGTVHAEGRRLHRGRTSWVWEVEFTDDQGRLCATTRVTMAVRPRPDR